MPATAATWRAPRETTHRTTGRTGRWRRGCSRLRRGSSRPCR
ncbi:hypothetical protein [Ornithinimicrobium kibberense]